ncbi:MAG: FAD:protein FMN transferase [Hespellia sp.]|nr:FAD:protein FMN transferase [Hespellia sp.]
MKRFLAILLCICTLTSLTGCQRTVSSEPISVQDMLFDTIISIKIWGTDDTALLDHCIEMCKKYEQTLSRTIPDSEISQINNAGGSPVKVSEETAAVIKKGLEYGDLSDGRFDITIAPLSILWDFKNNTGVVPSETDITEARSHVNYKNVTVDGNTVTLSDPKAAIDLGGIAKGYIADQLKKYLESKNVTSGLISLGGNIVTIGSKIDGSDFNIGIQKPFDEQNSAITSVQVSDKSVVSSGVYERYFKVDDKLYHHILNPSTGYPYDNNLLEVTILSEQSVDGDALSTTCFAMGLEEGMALIDSMDGIEAIFVTDDYELHYTN